MSQSISLGNAYAVNFNGATVDKINLNGSQVWKASATIVSGYRQGQDFCVPVSNWGWWDPSQATGGWDVGTAEVGSISTLTPDNVTLAGATLTGIKFNTLGYLTVSFTGSNVIKRFNSVTINGYYFNHTRMDNTGNPYGNTYAYLDATNYSWFLSDPFTVNSPSTYPNFSLRNGDLATIGNALFPLGQTIQVSFT
jgi:hypothetical protein